MRAVVKADNKDPKDAVTPRPNQKPEPGTEEKADKKAAPLTPEQERQKLWDKIIANKISYVVLYDYKETQPGDDPARFELINTSVATKLVTSANSSSAAGTSDVGMQERSGPSRFMVVEGRSGSASGSSGWQPLFPVDAGGSSSGGHPMDRPGGLGAAAKPQPTRDSPRILTPGPAPTETTDKAAKAGLKRYEFVILFIWDEPFRPIAASADSGASSGDTSAGRSSGRIMAPRGN
jgi:hypothetical protein